VHSLGPNNAPRLKIYDAANRGSLNVKWRELDFTIFLNPTFKFVMLSKLIAACTPWIANLKIDVLWTANVRWLNLRAECHRPDSSAVFYRTVAVRSKGVIKR
jgi:hypothetical protein